MILLPNKSPSGLSASCVYALLYIGENVTAMLALNILRLYYAPVRCIKKTRLVSGTASIMMGGRPNRGTVVVSFYLDGLATHGDSLGLGALLAGELC
jgi:hypothetical protein